MANLPIPVNTDTIIETAKKGVEAVKEMYLKSDPEQRKLIIKTLAGLAGLGGFFKWLKSL